MQKARRFICSTASQSSPSNTTIQTRKKSRTSSAGGDSLAVSRTTRENAKVRSRPLSTKCDVRLLSTKHPKKTSKPSRAPRANVGNLQNAVVLAPFYTLKKCFQNKLVDLYANEKLKKTHKARLAKKQNMSFEYDIIELKPLESTVKKEAKPGNKAKQKSRSASYCQCKKVPSKGNASPKRSKKPSGKEFASPKLPSFSGPLNAKRRKLNSGAVTPTSLKSGVAPRMDFYGIEDRFGLSEAANPSSSVLSYRSKCESWETYSNTPSCREELVQGSLAISTTSFDSYLENFDKGSRDLSEGSRNRSIRAKNPQHQEQMDAEFLPKPTANLSRNNSDGEIVDFMDREPQTHVISVESEQNWQPLPRQSRTKRKKPESESAASYYLRSASKDREASGGSKTFLSAKRQERRSSCGSAMSKTAHVEVSTQVEEGSSEAQGPSYCFVEDAGRDDIPEEVPHDREWPLSEAPAVREPSAENQHPLRIESAEVLPEHSIQRPEMGPGMLGERSELQSVEMIGLPGAAAPHQDKESPYIFGTRGSASGLGEACEFSFGLKWVFSDDED